MQKLIVALSAVLITGVAGLSVAGGDAQDIKIFRPKAEKIEKVEAEEMKDPIFLPFEDLDIYTQHAPAAPMFVSNMGGQAGTWQIVTLDKMAILLNTATGETFTLDKGEEGLMWKPIARPMPQGRMFKAAAPREREMPDLDAKLETLRKELRGAKGDARERLEKAIEELEKARENANRARDPRKEGERKEGEREEAKREREKDNVEDQLREIEETIAALKERFEESDSVKEREKIEKTIKELRAKAEGLRKERKSR